MSNKPLVTAHKIDLGAFIKSLMSVWEEGFDFIDLEFMPEYNGKDPHVRIVAKEEYYETDKTDEEEENKSLEDDDLEKLI